MSLVACSKVVSGFSRASVTMGIDCDCVAMHMPLEGSITTAISVCLFCRLSTLDLWLTEKCPHSFSLSFSG